MYTYVHYYHYASDGIPLNKQQQGDRKPEETGTGLTDERLIVMRRHIARICSRGGAEGTHEWSEASDETGHARRR